MNNLVLSTSSIDELCNDLADAVAKKLLDWAQPIDSESKNEFWSIETASEELHVSKVTIHDHINRGLYPSYKIGRRTLLKPKEVLSAVQKIEV